MKRFHLIPAFVAIILMFTAVSCTTMTGTQDEYYERSATPNRLYVEDPYRGTIVYERDPYSGRYYEVNSFGSNNNRIYRNNDTYGRTYDNRSRNYNRGNTPRVYDRADEPTQEEKKELLKNRDEARKKVLGN